MSAGVSDQRMKGQGNGVSNGPKEQLGGEAAGGPASDHEFETWRTQQQQAAAAANPYGSSVPISSATDLYSMSTGYYGSGGGVIAPYQAYGVGDGTWSNGQDPMTFLGGYHHDSYSIDGMFGPSTTFSTPNAAAFGQHSSFNYFHSNGGDYNTWGNQLGQRKYDEYYRDQQQQQNMYTQAMSDSLKSVEQGMHNLDLKACESKDPKKMTWASIASQPAKPPLPAQSQSMKKKGPGMPPGPIIPGKHNMDIGTWDTSKATPPQQPPAPPPPPPPTFIPSTPPVSGKSMTGGGGGGVPPPAINVRPAWNGPGSRNASSRPLPPPPPPPTHVLPTYHQPPTMLPPTLPSSIAAHVQALPPPPPLPHHAAAMMHPVLDELRGKNNYNPGEFDLSAPHARFFVIKSYSEDDIHRSIKYEIWCSTEHGNKRLDQAYRERERDANGAVYLFFSVNGSGHFCGMAQMVSPLDYNSNSSVWSQDKWKGQFRVRWIYVKDVPNVQLRYIRLENNENKPVTNSRDTQEVPHAKGLQVLRIIHTYRHSTSIFDDFVHYEKRQEEEDTRKQPDACMMNSAVVKSHCAAGDDRERDQRNHHHHQRTSSQHEHDLRQPHHHSARNHDGHDGRDRERHYDRVHHKDRGDRSRGGRNRN